MKAKYDAVTILIALTLCGAVTLITGCSGELYSTLGMRRIDEYRMHQTTYDRPLKCLFGNFDGCRTPTEIQGS